MKQVALFLFLFAAFGAKAQVPADTTKKVDLDAYMSAGEEKEKKEPVTATFKSSRIINSQSVEMVKPKHLEFRISHRFNTIRDGLQGFFGLDNATIRLALEYGITDYLMVGIGRSSLSEKSVDGFIKARFIKQKKGGFPLTISGFVSGVINTNKVNTPNYRFDSRLIYTYQVLMASKISDRISLQLMPTLVHRNLVPNATYQNDLMAMGIGGRVKVSRRISINAEYFYRFLWPSYRAIDPYHNSLSVGVDIDTGGHIFSLHFSNSQSQIEKGFIGETNYNWLKGDFCFGFNITRQFYLGKKTKAPQAW